MSGYVWDESKGKWVLPAPQKELPAFHSQVAWEARRRVRLNIAIETSAEEAGFTCSPQMKTFLVKLLERLELDTK